MARFLQRALQSEGYAVELAFDGEQALAMGLSGGLDLMVLDVMLPRRDGLDVIRNLRAAKQTLPTIIVSARNDCLDIIHGLDLGADDYLTKPFALDVLLARVRALTRRGPNAYPRDLQFEDLTLHSRTHELRRAQRTAALTRTEYALMETLMRRAGCIVPREVLVDAGWGGGAGGQRRHALRFRAGPQGQDRNARRTSVFAHRPRSWLHVADRSALRNASISLRLTFWYSAMVLCGLTILGVAMWVDLAYSLNKGRDRTLARRAARFLDLVEGPQRSSGAARGALPAVGGGHTGRKSDSALRIHGPAIPSQDAPAGPFSVALYPAQ